MKKNFLFILFVVLVTTADVKANNMSITKVSINGQNLANHFSMVNFDISWEHSWRTLRNEANYDGAWVFVKFRRKSSSVWQHATINITGSTAPAGSVIKTSLDKKGVWIYHEKPSTDFIGNVNYTGARIRWNYGADGVLDTDDVEMRIFAVEMVYVPAGSYFLGGNGDEANKFVGRYWGYYNTFTDMPYSVEGEGGIIAQADYGKTIVYPGATYGTIIPGAFPKGYNAFWIMKYECSQQQYVDFLNNLDALKANNRYSGMPGMFSGVHPSFIAPYPERAMNFAGIMDYLAFADWSGLRPFTEFEYEKACRGTSQTPVPNEYPWGNTTISPTTADAIAFPGKANEYALNGNANYSFFNLNRPARTGMYATGTSQRTSSGGTYYGIMDMGGNVRECAISVNNPSGRAFTNVNGDGKLSLGGYADVLSWPTDNSGFIGRGGSYLSPVENLRTSERVKINFPQNGNPPDLGIRLARTAE